MPWPIARMPVANMGPLNHHGRLSTTRFEPIPLLMYSVAPSVSSIESSFIIIQDDEPMIMAPTWDSCKLAASHGKKYHSLTKL
jgi:hypothetical protein